MITSSPIPSMQENLDRAITHYQKIGYRKAGVIHVSYPIWKRLKKELESAVTIKDNSLLPPDNRVGEYRGFPIYVMEGVPENYACLQEKSPD